MSAPPEKRPASGYFGTMELPTRSLFMEHKERQHELTGAAFDVHAPLPSMHAGPEESDKPKVHPCKSLFEYCDNQLTFMVGSTYMFRQSYLMSV
jgi:hypothetical protein